MILAILKAEMIDQTTSLDGAKSSEPRPIQNMTEMKARRDSAAMGLTGKSARLMFAAVLLSTAVSYSGISFSGVLTPLQLLSPPSAAAQNEAPDGGSPAAAVPLPNEKCVCGEKPALAKLLEESAVAFVGRAEKLDNNPRRPGYIEVAFTVLNRFKGFDEIKTPKVLIYTPKEPTCTYTFRIGLDYLVFASGTPANFKVDLCSGTEILENSFTDVERLKRMTSSDPANKMPVEP